MDLNEEYSNADEYDLKQAKLEIIRKRDAHKGDWITMDIAREYHAKAMKLPENGCQDIGERRKLRIELQKKYGLADIEAINIINGHHLDIIVTRYERIKNAEIIQAKRSSRKKKECLTEEDHLDEWDAWDDIN